MAERGAIGRRLDELPMGLAASIGVAAGVGAGAGLMAYGGVGALVGFCGAVGASAGVALSGKPVAEVVATRIEMVHIRGGTFSIGSGDNDQDAADHERPRHK